MQQQVPAVDDPRWAPGVQGADQTSQDRQKVDKPSPPPPSISMAIARGLENLGVPNPSISDVADKVTGLLPQNVKAGLFGLLEPFSARDPQGNARVPPVLSSTPGGMRTEEDGKIGKISGPSGIAQKGKEAVQSIKSSDILSQDPQTRSEGIGHMAAAVASLTAAAKAFGSIKDILPPGPEWGAGGKVTPRTSPPKPPPIDVTARVTRPGLRQIPEQTGIQATATPNGAPIPQPSGPPVSPQSAMGSGPAAPQMLPSGGVHSIPGATSGVPITPDPGLLSHYANMPAETAPAGPGLMGKGINLGEEGGIPARGEQTVTPVYKPVKLPDGTMHTPTADEFERGFITSHDGVSLRDANGHYTKVTIKKAAAEAPTPPPKAAAKKGKS